MSANAETVATTALSLPDRAKRALAKVTCDAKLIELARQSTDLVAIIDRPGALQVHGARMVLKDTRIEIEKAGKEARDDATKFSKAVIVEEQRLIALFRHEEDRLQALEAAWEFKIEAERQAKIEAEKKRIAGIRNAIANIHDDFFTSGTESSAEIIELLDALDKTEIGDAFAELKAEAQSVKNHCVMRLQKAYESAKEREAEAVRLKAEREELDRQRAVQEAAAKIEAARLRAERDAQEAALRIEREEAARVQRQADEKTRAERAEHAAIAKAEAERIKKEREAHEAALRVEREAAEKAQREADAKATAERAERDRIAAEARAIEAQRIAADRAEVDRQLRKIAEDKRQRDESDAQERAIEEEQKRHAKSVLRPTDAEIIEVLALHFRVSDGSVIEWLLNMDLEAARSEFA